jgi:ABC-type transport system substrate-binding protein
LQLKSDFEGHFQVVRGPYFNTEYLGFLLDSSARGANRALLNPLVRQALHHATDRVTLVRSLRRGVGYPGHGGLLPPGLPGFDSTSLNPKTSNPYQPLLASEILRKAGYGPTHPLRLVLETNPSYADIAQYLQSLWAPLGIQVEIKLSQGPALRQSAEKKLLSLGPVGLPIMPMPKITWPWPTDPTKCPTDRIIRATKTAPTIDCIKEPFRQPMFRNAMPCTVEWMLEFRKRDL